MRRYIKFCYVFLLNIIFSTSFNTSASAKTFKEYEINLEPFKAFPKEFAEYKELSDLIKKGQVDEDYFIRRMVIIEQVLKINPKWVDGLWLFTADSFQLASLIYDENLFPKAINILNRGQKTGELCLTIEAENPLCKLFLGSIIAKRGTLEGVLTALDQAERVEKLWLDVTKSEYNFQFTDNISMQGAARFGLGIFYRLVPDLAILDWLYNVRGNLDKSIEYHRISLAIDNRSLPCSNLMLGVSLVCKAGSKEKAHWEEGMKFMTIAKNVSEVFSVNSSICKKDAKKLLESPQGVCEYSIVGTQKAAKESDFVNKAPVAH